MQADTDDGVTGQYIDGVTCQRRYWKPHIPGVIADREQPLACRPLVDSMLQDADIGGGVGVEPLQKELAPQ